MTRRGRPAQLPSPGYEPPPRLIDTATSCTVDFYPEQGGAPVRFDFTRLPVHHDLQMALAKAFERITGPSGSRHAKNSARNTYAVLASFARLVAQAPDPPQCAADLTIAHVDCFVVAQRYRSVVSSMRGALLKVEDLPEVVRLHLMHLALPLLPQDSKVSSYTRREERRIIQAARATLQAAAKRIRAGVECLSRWRAGEIDQRGDRKAWQYGYLLDYLAKTGDVPRYENKLAVHPVYRHGGIAALMGALFLTAHEAAAACVLLICSTGINGEALATTTIAHERADSGEDETPIAVIDVVKPRRGQRARYMTVPLDDVPRWAGEHQAGELTLSEQDEFDTPFGIYMLMLELTAPARALCRSDWLFLWASPFSIKRFAKLPLTPVVHEGLPSAIVPQWGKQACLTTDPAKGSGETRPVEVTMPRLRLTFLQRHQYPVAQSQRTFDDQYMLRDQGSLLEYQQLVAKALHEQEKRARDDMRAVVMTEDLRRLATSDPVSTASKCQMTVDTLTAVVDGQKDTVFAACIDFKNGRYGPPGCDCEASFFMCLSCPCARVLPHHLPILLHTRDELEQRRDTMTDLAWVNVFGGPHAQLNDVIGCFSEESRARARSALSDTHRDLVREMLNREWDLT